MTHGEPCVVLPWDSEFFGLRIGRVVPPALTHTDVSAAVEWAEKREVACLYALIDAHDAASRASLEAFRFRAVDERLTLRRTIGLPLTGERTHSTATWLVRPATLEDAKTIAALARVSHRNTRFYADGGFDRDRCDELYATWAVQAISERDAIMLISVDDTRVNGYFSIHELREPECRAGLVAVGTDDRGRGVGRCLMRAAVQTAAERGCKEMLVVTQGGNGAAVRYYESSGFRRARAQVWYHWWWRRWFRTPKS